MNVRTGVVLAAGEGTRLRPLTENRPKPMLAAGTRPILEHVCDALVDAGVERLVLVVGYERDRVQDHVGPTYRDVPVEYVVQEKQLGSGHALLQAVGTVGGPLLAVNGDRVIDASMVQAVMDAFSPDCSAVVSAIDHGNHGRYGTVALDGNRVTSLVEKPTEPASGLINAGIYAFRPDIFDSLEATPRTDGELPITDTVGRLIDEGTVCGVQVDGLWADATYPWDLLYLTRRLLEEGQVPGTETRPGTYVDPAATVHDDATLQAPVVVGPDVEVGAGAVVGPETALGRNATLEANATVARSVLDADVRVGPSATLLDCVAGEDVTVGPDALVPGGPADVRIDTRVFEDQRLGAVVADRARLGGGATCEPGTLVGPNATVGTGAHARDHVDAGAEVTR
jgi:glucose-1-phosphate thymidylyltransferase